MYCIGDFFSVVLEGEAMSSASGGYLLLADDEKTLSNVWKKIHIS